MIEENRKRDGKMEQMMDMLINKFERKMEEENFDIKLRCDKMDIEINKLKEENKRLNNTIINQSLEIDIVNNKMDDIKQNDINGNIILVTKQEDSSVATFQKLSQLAGVDTSKIAILNKVKTLKGNSKLIIKTDNFTKSTIFKAKTKL